jgi:hypothetical protein
VFPEDADADADEDDAAADDTAGKFPTYMPAPDQWRDAAIQRHAAAIDVVRIEVGARTSRRATTPNPPLTVSSPSSPQHSELVSIVTFVVLAAIDAIPKACEEFDSLEEHDMAEALNKATKEFLNIGVGVQRGPGYRGSASGAGPAVRCAEASAEVHASVWRVLKAKGWRHGCWRDACIFSR